MLYKITPSHILFYKPIHREIFIFLSIIIKNLFTSSFCCFSFKYLYALMCLALLLATCLIFLQFSAARGLPRSLPRGAWACSEC